jgi:arsenical pump membrane protein
LAIAVTYAALRYTQRLTEAPAVEVPVPVLTTAGRAAAAGIVLTALLLMTASALDWRLGPPTCAAGALTLIGVAGMQRCSPWRYVRELSWGIIPLVAGLFVLVEGLDRSGTIRALSELLQAQASRSVAATAAAAGATVGFVANLMNNLPAGLIAGTAIQAAQAPAQIASAVLVGIDLGPNLSVTGSLATILWLNALRRAGVQVRARDFLMLGVVVMPPALALALAALIL